MDIPKDIMFLLCIDCLNFFLLAASMYLICFSFAMVCMKRIVVYIRMPTYASLHFLLHEYNFAKKSRQWKCNNNAGLSKVYEITCHRYYIACKIYYLQRGYNKLTIKSIFKMHLRHNHWAWTKNTITGTLKCSKIYPCI